MEANSAQRNERSNKASYLESTPRITVTMARLYPSSTKRVVAKLKLAFGTPRLQKPSSGFAPSVSFYGNAPLPSCAPEDALT